MLMFYCSSNMKESVPDLLTVLKGVLNNLSFAFSIIKKLLGAKTKGQKKNYHIDKTLRKL